MVTLIFPVHSELWAFESIFYTSTQGFLRDFSIFS